ncbi:hypothetical protein [Luteipulveratus mongoliensis]|uniref:Uncharacterized protein n=1 Tax=Luteipulveratus mongoliensis TaxID=571913 RepID=A0A0K1JFH7_9MICO|nr:hypothetical protein [Luteipulveratus mongoliensis]AKU15456.1 hypothetical protein VV02_05545 [Luteipulveratus mongoliensis]
MTPWRALALVLLLTGVALMIAASIWAPNQPEFFNLGGACQLAPCGELEDPPRWHAAWWLWTAGAVLAIICMAPLSDPMRFSARALLASVLAVPIGVVVLTYAAMMVALFTSTQGAATVVVLGAVLPVTAAVAGLFKRALEDERDREDEATREALMQ